MDGFSIKSNGNTRNNNALEFARESCVSGWEVRIPLAQCQNQPRSKRGDAVAQFHLTETEKRNIIQNDLEADFEQPEGSRAVTWTFDHHGVESSRWLWRCGEVDA